MTLSDLHSLLACCPTNPTFRIRFYKSMYLKLAGCAAAAVASQQFSALPAAAAAAKRLYKSSVVAMGHGSHSSDNSPDILEKEKQRNLTGKTPEIIPGNPGFNPALASDSEAAIRAERAPSLDMDELQQHSVKIIQHLHHEEEHPVPEQVPNPSEGSPAIRENLERSSQKRDQHDPL